MFNYNNTHIFTGYLKQLLASVNIPTCKIYTKEFADYLERTGQEDPRVVESIDVLKIGLNTCYPGAQINYLKNNNIMYYKWENPENRNHASFSWVQSSKALFLGNNHVDGLTRTLKNSGNFYDTKTHNYLGDFLRFLRDYHGVNLMSLYNCFDNKIYNNVYLTLPKDDSFSEFTISSSDPSYKIYAVPVKLFADYTIAIDCSDTLELFCGFYSTRLDATSKGRNLIRQTYQKIQKTSFHRPFLYTGLNVKNWNRTIENSKIIDTHGVETSLPLFMSEDIVTRWDILNREQDLKLFIKVPSSCKSSIVVLEGDYRTFNDYKYTPTVITANSNEHTIWRYSQNACKINFHAEEEVTNWHDPETGDKTPIFLRNKIPPLDERPFKPICKLQLLYLNTGESYPFADRLVEYLTGSAITSIDEISDNIKRAQKVMSKNGFTFSIDGLWEPQMQRIAYDYIMNSGPISVKTEQDNSQVLTDKHQGAHPQLGHKSNSSVFDILGYIDKDVEKWYATWQLKSINGRTTSTAVDTIQETDIYNGLYDLD